MTKTPRSKYLNVRISDREDEAIRKAADKAGMKKSDYVRRVLYKGIPDLRRKAQWLKEQ